MDCLMCSGHSAVHVGQKGFLVFLIVPKSPCDEVDLQRLMLQLRVHLSPKPSSAGSTTCTQAFLDLPVASLLGSILWISARCSGAASSPLVSMDDAKLSSSSEISGSGVLHFCGGLFCSMSFQMTAETSSSRNTSAESSSTMFSLTNSLSLFRGPLRQCRAWRLHPGSCPCPPSGRLRGCRPS